MAKYCPYTDFNTTYLTCQECGDKICSPDTFFCLVVGSRSFTDYALMERTLNRLLTNQKHTVIVSGGASGADSLAEEYARKHNLTFLPFPADWNKYGKSAGYIRNEEMHRFIAKQLKRGVIAFWDGKSKGTQHSFELAKKYGNEIRIVHVSTEK